MSVVEKGINTHGKPIKPTPEALRILASIYDLDYIKLMNIAGYISSDDIKKTVPVPSLSAKVNVYGSIRAGSPTFAEQEIIGNVSVSDKVEKRYGKENLFALMVKGNSMNLKVLPGYVAIFAKDTEINNGDTVAVLIDGEDATIKNYRKTSVAVMFEPQSSDPTFQPIVFPKSGVQDFRILGKMVYVVSGDYI